MHSATKIVDAESGMTSLAFPYPIPKQKGIETPILHSMCNLMYRTRKSSWFYLVSDHCVGDHA